MVKPRLGSGESRSRGSVIMATVKGDLHDIGKNLFALMLEGAAFEFVDLGVDVSPEKFVESVKTHQPAVVGLSALLTTTMSNMKTTIEALKVAGLRDQVKIIIGGSPVTAAYARDIGAAGFPPDASRAGTLIKTLVG